MRPRSVKVMSSYIRKVRGCKVLYERIWVGSKFFMESGIGSDCKVSDKREIKVFMEGIIGDLERSFCDFV